MPYPVGVTYDQLIDRLRDSNAIFPNANDAIAELHPHSQTIHLHHILRTEIFRLLEGGEPWDLAPMFSVIAHEVTHWLDLLGTVWGQQYLVKLFDAYEAAFIKRESPEDEWWKVIRLFDDDRRIMFPRNYRVVTSDDVPHSVRRPWSIDYTCGQEFASDGKIDSARPIFFTVFGENPTRKRIARQPISVGTLLETNATWVELLTGIRLMSTMPDGGEKKVTIALWSREKQEILYNSQRTEYTAPVHLLSARTHTKDVMLSYHVGAAIASVCLNLTAEHFACLRIPDTFSPFGQERIEAFRAAQDRGFAFACIVFNAPEFFDNVAVDDWLSTALNRSGLPPVDIVHRDGFAKLEMLHRETAVRPPLDRVRDYLLEVARTIFVQRAEIGSEMTLMDLIMREVPLPLMFDSEGELFGIGKANLNRDIVDPEAMFNLEWDLRKFTTNFLMGCRGVVG